MGSKNFKKIELKQFWQKTLLKYLRSDIKINKKIIIKDYLKDHRVFMTSVIAALSFENSIWNIYDKDSINSSFPEFFKYIKKI